MTFRNSLKKLGLAGILAAGIFGNEASAQYPVVIYGPVPNPPVIRRSLVIVGPQVIVRPPERIMIVDPIFYPPVAAPRVESICFDLPSLEPGNYTTIIERREGVCDVLDKSWNFSMNLVTPGRIFPNSKQNLSWEINTPGHYEIFISGAGKRRRLGCGDFNQGDKIQFYKTSEPFTENHVIKPHPYKDDSFLIKKEPRETFRSSIRVINPDGSSYFSITKTDGSGNVLKRYHEHSDNAIRFERNPAAPLPYSTTPWIRHSDGTLELGRP